MNDCNVIPGFVSMCMVAQGLDAGHFEGSPNPYWHGRVIRWPSRKVLVTALPMAYYSVGMQIAQIAEFLAECSERFCVPQFDVDIDDLEFATKYLDPETGEVTDASGELVSDETTICPDNLN